MEAIASHINNLLDQELRELCCTCDHRHSCTYRQQAHKRIIQCELFSGAETVAASLFTEPEPLVKTSPGLCGTCVHQRTCGFFNRNGYVWHCEEFA